MPDEDENEDFEAIPDDQRAGALHIIDDGCDWSAWLVWNMNSRRRISEHQFAQPPAKPKIIFSMIKPKKIANRRNKKKIHKEIK